jgi:hypothetical protein
MWHLPSPRRLIEVARWAEAVRDFSVLHMGRLRANGFGPRNGALRSSKRQQVMEMVRRWAFLKRRFN